MRHFNEIGIEKLSNTSIALIKKIPNWIFDKVNGLLANGSRISVNENWISAIENSVDLTGTAFSIMKVEH